MKIVVPGGSGFLGGHLVPRFRSQGHDVIVVTRSEVHEEPRRDAVGSLRCVRWSDASALHDAVNGADLVLNLAGKSVDCRYTAKNKAAILDSRVNTTRAIGTAIAASNAPPPVWMNASTATVYREARDRPMTESDHEVGTGFSVGVGTQWEEALFERNLRKTRRVALRITIALAMDGGVIPPCRNLVRFGLGGKQGDGGQMFSWIHVEDLCRAVEFLWEREDMSGPVNLAAPGPVTNAEFMAALRRTMKMPIGLPAATWMTEIGAFFLRTETELILKSRWVLPQRLMDAGFEFQFPDLESALADLFQKQV